MYVLQREEDGLYCVPPGAPRSYTERLQNAQVFDSREEAEENRCGNERILHVEQAMNWASEVRKEWRRREEDGRFILSIKLNDVAKEPADVGYLLQSAARSLMTGMIKGEISDMNGNVVGHYQYVRKSAT